MSAETLEPSRPAGPHAERAAGLWLACIVVVGAALRMSQLGAHSLWFDEFASIELSSQPLSLLWSDWMVRESNPPLYYTLLHLWMRAFGDSEAVLRFPSAVLGSTVPLLLYALGRRVASTRAGLIAAALGALSASQLEYSLEVRSYILAVVAALVVALALCRLTEHVLGPAPSPPRAEALTWALYVAGCAAALYLHTTLAALPLVANGYFLWLWAARSRRDPGIAVRWVLANALCLLLWLWWASITLKQLAGPNPNHAWIQRPGLVEAVIITASVYVPARLGPASYLIGAVLLVAAGRGLRHMSREHAVLLAAFGVGAPLFFGVVSQWVPVLMPRTILWVQFAVLVALATSLAALPGRWWAVAVSGVLALQLMDSFNLRRMEKEPWRDIVSALRQRAGPRDVVLFTKEAHGAHLLHYCRKPECQLQPLRLQSPDVDVDRWAAGFYPGPTVQQEDLAAVLARHDTVYTVGRYGDDPSKYLMGLAEEDFDASLAMPANHIMRVRVWRAKSPTPPAPAATTVGD
jgi:mannosyltransferase